MPKFNQFEFLENRTKCVPLNQEEIETFDLWNTLIAFSIAEGSMPVADKINRLGFSRLPKKIQCMAFTQLEGKNLRGQWQKAKAKKIKSKKEYIHNLCELLGCSENEAKDYVRYNTFDEKVIKELYIRVYEPENVKIRKKRK